MIRNFLLSLVIGLLFTSVAVAKEGCVVDGAAVSCYKEIDNVYVGTYFYKPGFVCPPSVKFVCMPGDLGPQICQHKYIRSLASIKSMKMSCSMQFPEKCSNDLDCIAKPGFGPYQDEQLNLPLNEGKQD